MFCFCRDISSEIFSAVRQPGLRGLNDEYGLVWTCTFLSVCKHTWCETPAEQRQYLFTGRSRLITFMASDESLVPKNHFTVDLCKGMLKEVFFILFTLFVSLETRLSKSVWSSQQCISQRLSHMSFLEAKQRGKMTDFACQITYNEVFLLLVWQVNLWE